MSESSFLAILRVLLALFPPFAAILARYLPDDAEEPLVGRVKAILPIEGASFRAVQTLEQRRDDSDHDEHDT